MFLKVKFYIYKIKIRDYIFIWKIFVHFGKCTYLCKKFKRGTFSTPLVDFCKKGTIFLMDKDEEFLILNLYIYIYIHIYYDDR